MSTFNWWVLETQGSQPIMLKNLPRHCTTLNIIFGVTNFMSCSIPIVNRGVVSLTLKFNPTLFVIFCKNKFGDYRFTMLQLPSLTKWYFIQTPNHPQQCFVTCCWTRERKVLANGWTHPSSMTTFVHLLIRSVIWEVTVLTIDSHMIYSVDLHT
jgi:hypothetical protein